MTTLLASDSIENTSKSSNEQDIEVLSEYEFLSQPVEITEEHRDNLGQTFEVSGTQLEQSILGLEMDTETIPDKQRPVSKGNASLEWNAKNTSRLSPPQTPQQKANEIETTIS
ncbi:hypothetical protein RFI_35908 [Reticulomyxa filosa]|uniref:Uncharacterized protein n=1 Tax=Reticulomyxa filosa TaxID=46433 RepID=X6LK69_RETFI|nr:hypothetical protein RFI_35908 [Reticulomyxa filosa]|eukprot:ETO01532.1 hypothetical protein RFI_35908 [Reticulomyxa filosa]